MSTDKIVERGKLLLGYLPAIYRMDAESEAFLQKFLGIFGHEIIDMEEKIADIPRYFDPKALTSNEGDFLSWLTSWLSLDLFSQQSFNPLNQNANLNRDYILTACQFYRAKGTEAGVIALLEFFSDDKVCVKDRSLQIFRTYSYELVHDGYHQESYTLDTDDSNILVNMGKYGDTVHYIFGEDSYVIDAHLVALHGMDDSDPQLAITKQVLKKLVEPFVPAIWRVEIKKMAVVQKLLGNDDKNWGSQIVGGGAICLQKFTAIAGTLREIRVKFKANSNIQVAVYSDNAGSPGIVLAYATARPVVSGWNTISLNTAVNLSATNYWLAFIVQTTNTIWASSTGGVMKWKYMSYGSAFPDNPTGLSSGSADIAIAGWGF